MPPQFWRSPPRLLRPLGVTRSRYGPANRSAGLRTARPGHVGASGREDPLPAPLPARVRVLPHECSGKLDPAGAALEVLVVLPPYKLEVPRKVGLDGGGEHRHRG